MRHVLEDKDYKYTFVQFILYTSAFVLGFFVTIPVGITLRNFQGNCPLYAQIVWHNSIIFPWQETSCDYALYANIAINIFYAAFMAMVTFLIIRPRPSQEWEIAWSPILYNIQFVLKGAAPVLLFINTCTLAMVTGSAFAISHGLSVFCQFAMTSLTDLGILTSSSHCADVQHIDWTKFTIIGGYTRGVWGYSFFTCFMIALIANWLLVIVWATLWFMQIAKMCYACAWEVATEKRMPVSKFSKVAMKRLNASMSTTGGAMTPRGGASFAVPGGITPRPGGMTPSRPVYAVPQQQAYHQPIRMAPPPGANVSMQRMAPPPGYAMGPPPGQLMPRMAAPPSSNGSYSRVPDATSEV